MRTRCETATKREEKMKKACFISVLVLDAHDRDSGRT
jgi:hypothetical protein